MVVRMASPWKHPKTGVYYFRKRVPTDLISAVGQHEVKVSLQTQDPAEAKRFARDIQAFGRQSAGSP